MAPVKRKFLAIEEKVEIIKCGEKFKLSTRQLADKFVVGKSQAAETTKKRQDSNHKQAGFGQNEIERLSEEYDSKDEVPLSELILENSIISFSDYVKIAMDLCTQKDIIRSEKIRKVIVEQMVSTKKQTTINTFFKPV
ncbi:hypothetical protein FQA39_LY15661 [Lamprigera yunnana]|nr:hypothetical protein FQA39_LY15661 [Lamprigera yunnana]